MPFTSEYSHVRGVRLHYLRWPSSGPPLLILHGNTHCGGVYAPLGEALAGEFDVLALDLRGHGQSDKASSYAWADLRDDVIGLIEGLELSPVVLVAHSRGGGASLLAASKRPDLVRAAIVYEPTVPYWGPRPEGAASGTSRPRRPPEAVLGRRSVFPDREEMYRHFEGRGLFRNWRDDYLRAFVEHASVEREDGTIELASPPTVEAALYEAMVDVTEWENAASVDVPLLAVFGDSSGRIGEGRDPVAPIRSLFPRVEVAVQANSTHSGPMEHPDVFERSVREFARRHP